MPWCVRSALGCRRCVDDDFAGRSGLTVQMMNVIDDTPAQQGLLLKGGKTCPLSEANKLFNYKMLSTRARVEHVFRVIKRQFGYTKVRYKGIAKNAAQVFSLIGLTNLYLARGAMMN